MSAYLPFIIIGLTLGSAYGLAAMGLTLTYKTSGVFNFGHGALAALSAVLFYELREVRGLAWPVAAFIAVFVFGVVAGALMERAARALADVPSSAKIVATVGLIVAIRAFVTLVYGDIPLAFRPFLPRGSAFEISGVSVSWENVVIGLLGAVSAAGLYFVFSRTQTGRAMQGVVDDPELLDITGISPTRVRRAAWIIGCCFAAASGILFAATQQQLDATLLALLVVQAFGAAAIGRFTNLPLAYVGGLAVGVLQAVVSKEAGAHSWLRGLDINIPFLILFVVLLITPPGKLVELGRRVRPARASGPVLPRPALVGAVAVVGAIAVAIPHVADVRLVSWTQALTQMVLFLSLALLVRTSGQISLCQIGFAAVGGAAMAHLTGDGLPWFLALLLAGLVAVPVGAIVAIPAIRLSGLYLGLATLGFGILLAQYFYGKSFFFGSEAALDTVRPAIARGDVAYYYVCLGVAAVAFVVVAVVERSRLGRLLRGLGDSQLALTTLGATVSMTQVIVFCLSAFLAGISGGLTASIFTQVNQEPFFYFQSITALAVLSIAGPRTLTAAIVAPLVSVIPPAYIDSPDTAMWLQLLFGCAAIAVSMIRPGQVADRAAKSLARREERWGASAFATRFSRPRSTLGATRAR
ncbi:MAG: ABC transporter permease [Actinomycetota bacterium]|nr:ABC transporter permease [Actinomycetota bacterium]